MAKFSSKSNSRTIVQVIREKYADLNDTHKKVADFILQNLEKATFSSLLEISKEIGVSDASLIRFARELGYKGYQDLRGNLVDYIRKIIYPSHKSALLEDRGQHPSVEIVMKKEIEYITKTMAAVDTNDFNALIELIMGARRIFCMGWGCSSFLAEYLVFGLRYLSYDAIAVTRDRKPMVNQVLFMDGSDILITFDLLPYSAEVLEAVEYVFNRGQGTRIITITNDRLTQIVQYSYLSFFCDMAGHLFKLVSLSAPICFTNAILEEVTIRDRRRSINALSELQHVIDSGHLHYSQFDPRSQTVRDRKHK